MSWDVWLATEVDGHEVEITPSFNYTHNCNPMIRLAGFEQWPYELNGMACRQFCSKLADALHEMRRTPDRYRAMDPENGWGDFDSLRTQLTKIHDTFDRYPSATVRCSA